MFRKRACMLAPLVCLIVLSATLAPAAENVLSVVPENALGYMVINRLADTDAKVQALGREMQLPIPSLLAMLKAAGDVEDGLDEKGCAAVVLMAGKDAEARPFGIVFVPITDYGKFLEPLHPDDLDAKITKVTIKNESFVVGNDGGYAVFTEPKYRDALETVLDAPNRVAADVAAWQPWLDKHEVAVVVTRHGIKFVSTKGQEALRQAKGELAKLGAQMEPALAAFGIYETILDKLGEEVQIYAAAIRFGEDSTLYESERVRFIAGGQAAKFFEKAEAPKGDLLAALPAGPFVGAFAAVVPEGAMEAMMDFSLMFMASARDLYGLDEEQIKKLTEISRESMKSVRGMSAVLAVGKPGDPLYSNMAFTMTVDDAEAFLVDYDKSLKAMNEMAKTSKSWILTTMEAKSIEIGGAKGLEISTKFPTPPAMEQVPNFNFDELMEKLFGPGGKITAYLAIVDDHTVAIAYTSKDLLTSIQAVAKGSKPALADDENLARTAAMLPPGAPCVAYFSPKGTVDFINRLMATFVPVPEAKIQLPEFPQTQPIGFAVTTAENELQAHTVVPASVLKAIGNYIIEVKKKVFPGQKAVEVEANLF